MSEQFGPYMVYEQLGVGGMAQVHRAIAANDAFQRPVALKRMLSHIASSEDMVKSFVREARLASFLRHENVAQTYDLGRVGDTYFIVMELITGRNLRAVLRHCGSTTGPMPVQFALNILNQICDALDYAHNLRDDTGQPLGIIHRDVSPSNVIVSETGVVKLIDFGIAKASGAGMQTMSGTLKGKFAYMAPEYIAGHIDARADLFAVGVIAHELLTNRPLFAGRDDIDTLTRVRDMQIAPPSKKNPLVPPEIDDIVMTALARDPDRRWQHATALRTALTTLTKRLGLVASNAQVVEWLDWAFSQKPNRGGRTTERDTDTDTDTDNDTAEETADHSLSSEQQTVEQRTIKQRALERGKLEPPGALPAAPEASKKPARVLGDDEATPPSKPLVAERSPEPAASPAAPLRNIASSASAMPRGSSAFPARIPSSSAAPPNVSRARPASAPPPGGPRPAAQGFQLAPALIGPAAAGAARPGGASPSPAAAAPSSQSSVNITLPFGGTASLVPSGGSPAPFPAGRIPVSPPDGSPPLGSQQAPLLGAVSAPPITGTSASPMVPSSASPPAGRMSPSPLVGTSASPMVPSSASPPAGRMSPSPLAGTSASPMVPSSASPPAGRMSPSPLVGTSASPMVPPSAGRVSPAVPVAPSAPSLNSSAAAPARTIPVIGAPPAFPAARVKSPSAPPPQGFPVTDLLGSSRSNAAVPPSAGAAFQPSAPSPQHGQQAFHAAKASAPAQGFAILPAPQNPKPAPPSPQGLPAPQPSRSINPAIVAFLVLLAAAGAAITVYFVLPLLT